MKFLAPNSFVVWEGKPKDVRGLSAECDVQCGVLSAKFKVRLLSAENFSAARERCPPERTTRQSLFATRCFSDLPNCQPCDL